MVKPKYIIKPYVSVGPYLLGVELDSFGLGSSLVLESESKEVDGLWQNWKNIRDGVCFTVIDGIVFSLSSQETQLTLRSIYLLGAELKRVVPVLASKGLVCKIEHMALDIDLAEFSDIGVILFSCNGIIDDVVVQSRE